MKQQLIFILGPSSVGKSTVIQNIKEKNIEYMKYISVDDIFDELKINHIGPWKTIKPKVRPNAIEKIKKDKETKIFIIDDNECGIYDYFNKHCDEYDIKLFILYANLRILNNRIKTREIPRTKLGVISNLTDFFIYKSINKKTELKLSYNDILSFLDKDEINAMKIYKKFNLPKELIENKKYTLNVKNNSAILINTDKKSPNEIAKLIIDNI